MSHSCNVSVNVTLYAQEHAFVFVYALGLMHAQVNIHALLNTSHMHNRTIQIHTKITQKCYVHMCTHMRLYRHYVCMNISSNHVMQREATRALPQALPAGLLVV